MKIHCNYAVSRVRAAAFSVDVLCTLLLELPMSIAIVTMIIVNIFDHDIYVRYELLEYY